MDKDIVYVTKTIKKDSIQKSSDSIYRLEFELDVATSHKDSVGDVLERSFLSKGAQDLASTYSAFFFNHNTNDPPVGKVIEARLHQLDDGQFAIRTRIGISKTEEKIATLIEEGILDKASIGFYPEFDSMKYDEETDTLHIYDGTIVEASIVGIPANTNAKVVSVAKSLELKSDEYKRMIKHKALNKDSEEVNMDMEAILKKVEETVKSATSQISEESDKVVAAKEEEFQKQLAEYKARNEELEKELEATKTAFLEELKKVKSEGRVTSAVTNKDKNDKYFYDDKEKALMKSFFDLGNIIAENKNFSILLMPSKKDDIFGDYHD